MATTKIKQLESFDSGSNYNFEDKRLDKTIPRSLFDKSHRNIGTMAETGVIMPLALIPTIPNESDDISIDILLRALPTVVPLESRQRLYIYAFYNRLGDLWKNFNTFMKRGYSGNRTDMRIPTLYNAANTEYVENNNVQQQRNESTKNDTWESNVSIQATSMGEALGLPHSYELRTIDNVTGYYNNTNVNKFINFYNTERDTTEKISALPFMMLLRIWRDYFTNKNYWINDRVMLPDDDEEFRMNDKGEVISAKNENKKILFDLSSKVRDITIDSTNNKYYFGLPYHEFPKDRFTSALPFMQRGDTPILENQLYNIGNEGGKLQLFASDGTLRANSNIINSGTGQTANGLQINAPGVDNIWGRLKFQNETSAGTSSVNVQNNDYVGVGSASSATIQLEITMNDLRKLAIEQSELEAMARTDGSYAEFGLTFFGKVSKNAQDHKPVYIGGMYKEIRYTEVVQTSESGATPMGSYTGHSSDTKNGYLGHIDTDDFGYIMILACIMPDVIYSEGLEKHWTDLAQEQFYMPQRAKLGMTAILKKEVRFNYTEDTAAQEENNNLFAYNNIFDEKRYIPNRVSGYMADMFRKEWAPYTQSRIIATTPVWGREFALASKNNVRNDYLYAPNEPPFTFDCGISIRSVQPIPYKPIPANLTGI